MSPLKYRLLIVEDNDDHADLINHVLSQKSSVTFDSLRARDAKDALEKLEKNDFEVILLDLNLPDSAPEETLKTFTTRFPNLPIVVFTALADERLIANALKWGAQDYLDKSHLRNDMVRSIRYAIERKRVLDLLEQQNDELKRFAQTVAHEVKSPVQTILTAFSLVRESTSGALDERLNKLIDLGLQSSDHLSRLVNEMLSFAESNTDHIEKESVDTDSLAREVIDSLQMMDGYSDSDFEIVDQLPSVPAFRSQLRQVFHNLLSNTIRYRTEDHLHVELSARESNDEWTFCIADNGIGIDPEHHQRIFDSLYRVHSRDEIPGTGIGLGFVKSVIERHGGKTWVESELGSGSSFYFTLPHGKPTDAGT